MHLDVCTWIINVKTRNMHQKSKIRKSVNNNILGNKFFIEFLKSERLFINVQLVITLYVLLQSYQVA